MVPAAGQLYDLDQEVLIKLSEFPDQIANSLEVFRFREALTLLMEVARMGNKYLADTEPWKLIKDDPGRVGTILNISLQITANLKVLADPFLPKTCKKLQNMLQLKELQWQDAGSADLLPAGHQLNKADLLFEKIEDQLVDRQVEKLKNSKIENAIMDTAALKEEIIFDDFKKMDIRIGKVVEAEKVAKSKKLLKLLVDTGLDQRTIVSGIAQHYSPEEVVGQQVTVLLNLAPRKIMGIESQGMILMAEHADGRFAFLQPDKDINPGGEVS
jgi:methionyl-tRNA synthetase